MENNQKSVATLRCVWQAIKENYGTILLVSCIIASIVLLITGCDNGDGAMMALAAVVAGTDGGTHVVDGPLTTDTVRQNSNDLLLNEIDRHIVKIRPMATPIDQISRYAHPRHSKSMIVVSVTLAVGLGLGAMSLAGDITGWSALKIMIGDVELSPLAIATVIAIVLNLIIPNSKPESEEQKGAADQAVITLNAAAAVDAEPNTLRSEPVEAAADEDNEQGRQS